MTPEEVAEIQMCDECISHLLENVGPDHIIVKYRTALIKLQEQAEEIIRANHRYADLQNICDDQYKEIKRLEAERAVWIKHYQDNRKKHAALKKLGEMVRARGEALVEERVKHLEPCNGECGKVDDPDCEECEYQFARKELRAEGVIR